MNVHVSNYSRGWIVEWYRKERCSSWLLLPAENLWCTELRGFLYLAAMIYIFLGMALVSDIFMCSIEVITSQKKKVARWDEEKQEMVEKEVLVWNETVANLTLMALGSSAPEIMLSVIVTLVNLGREGSSDDLGTFTIIGSAAFNLLLITAICIVSVPYPKVKKVKELGVFLVTSVWSIFAYLWVLIVLIRTSPGEIEVWEAWLTFVFFPIMVVTAYCMDNHCWCKRSTVEPGNPNVRVIGLRGSGMLQGVPKELGSKERGQKSMARNSAKDGGTENDAIAQLFGREGSPSLPTENEPRNSIMFTRTRIRHACMKSMMGNRSRRLVLAVRPPEDNTDAKKAELIGKFTFESAKFSVVEGTGDLIVDVLFHMDKDNQEKGVVSVDYETMEGSAIMDLNYKLTRGKLVFGESEDRKSITIPIIDNSKNHHDTEFYIILKNPVGGKGLANPSIATITITDDDVPGVFQFEESACFANLGSGVVQAHVARTNGSRGKLHIEFSTIDGSAIGGEEIADGVDYITTKGYLTFEDEEILQTIIVPINKKSKGRKTFVLTLKNPTSGGKIGYPAATVCTIAPNDDLARKLAEIMDDDEEESWLDQFRNALILEHPRNSEGAIVSMQWHHYWLHFLTIFWKLLFALIPPRLLLGAYPSFIGSLVFIGLLTCLIEQLGTLLGCVVGLEASVAGITIIAIGTSLPDTFASRTAALHDRNADAAIGNITGSNSVNVFLGLGVPWVISSMYHYMHNKPFLIQTGNLVSAVVIFATVGTVTIAFLLVRRYVVGGELGGRRKVFKWFSGLFLLCLWFVYVALAALKAYHVPLPW